MSDPQPLPGWYPDPAATGGNRWWTGAGWGDARQLPGPLPIVQPPLSPGTSTDTRWAIVQALLPVGFALATVPYFTAFTSLMQQQFALMREAGGSGTLPPADTRELIGGYAGAFGAFGLTGALSVLVSAAWVVCAVLDMRALQRIGLVQPFHWAWAFLGAVYPIGRAVVVHRRTGGGLRPLWVLIATWIASIVLMTAGVFVTFGAFFAELPSALPSVYSTEP